MAFAAGRTQQQSPTAASPERYLPFYITVYFFASFLDIKMLKPNQILIITCSIILASCGKTIKSVSGIYALDKVPKTRLILNSDRSFIFTKVNENPYLFTSDHLNQRFYIAKGEWDLLGNKIILSSSKDSLVYDLVKIVYDTTENLEYSKFRFYDIYEDSIGSGPILYSDSSLVAKGGAGRKADFYSFAEDMTKVKSLEFTFYGYGPWKYVPKDSFHHDMIIHFIPAFKPNAFNKTPLKVRGNYLIETVKKRKYKFRKIKTAGNIGIYAIGA